MRDRDAAISSERLVMFPDTLQVYSHTRNRKGRHDFESKDEATDGIEHGGTSSAFASVSLCLSILRASLLGQSRVEGWDWMDGHCSRDDSERQPAQWAGGACPGPGCGDGRTGGRTDVRIRRFTATTCSVARSLWPSLKGRHTRTVLQGSAKRRGLGCVHSLPGSAWL